MGRETGGGTGQHLCPLLRIHVGHDSHFTFEDKSDFERLRQLNKLRFWGSGPEWDCQNKTKWNIRLRPNFHDTSAIYLSWYRLHHQNKPFRVDLNNASMSWETERAERGHTDFFFTSCAALAYLEIKENIPLSCSVKGVVEQASGFSRQVHCKDWRPSSLSVRAGV